MRLAKQDIVTHAAVAEREGREGRGLCWRAEEEEEEGRRGEEEGRGGSIAEGGRFIIMIMALVTGLLAAAGLLCLLPPCLPGKGGRGLEGKGERDKALFLPFHRSFATASHVAPRCPLCGLALCCGRQPLALHKLGAQLCAAAAAKIG